MKETKKKILLVHPTNPEPPPIYFGPPYGIALIAAVLEKEQWPVLALDYSEKPEEEMKRSLIKIITKKKPDYIGISVQSASRGAVYRLVEMIKAIHKDCIIVLGGPFASLEYMMLLKNFPVDIIVIGEGEITVKELFVELAKERPDLRLVKGIAFMNNGSVVLTKKRGPTKDLDLLPYPAFHFFSGFSKRINRNEKSLLPDFFMGKRCTTLKNSLMLLSSRDCIYGCNFCPMSSSLKGGWRAHSPEYFVGMVEYFYRTYGIRKFIFGDNFFTRDRQRVMKICKLLTRKNLGIKWGCMTRSDYVDLPLLIAMRKAGCFEVSYGVESGSLKIQKMMGKNLDLIKTMKGIPLTQKAGMRSILMLMVGNFGETKETVEESLSVVKDLEPDNILVKITKAYPGTKIHSMMVQRKLISRAYYMKDICAPPFFTLEHSVDELKKLRNIFGPRRSFVNIVDEGSPVPLKTVTRQLSFAAKRSEFVVLVGDEPLLRNDIIKVLRLANSIPAQNLCAYTNGDIFRNRELLNKILTTRILKNITLILDDTVIIPALTAQVGADFFEIFKGIRYTALNFGKDVGVIAKIMVSKTNSPYISEFCGFLLAAGVRNFVFILMDDRVTKKSLSFDEIPDLKLWDSIAKTLVAFLKKNNAVFHFEGFPLCVLPKGIYNRFYFFDEVVSADGKMSNVAKQLKKNRIMTAACKKCSKYILCGGVWGAYTKKYANKGIKPM